MLKWILNWFPDKLIRVRRWWALKQVRKQKLACPVCGELADKWNPGWGHNYICCSENCGWIMKKKVMTLRVKKEMDRKYKHAQAILNQITASYNQLPCKPKPGLSKQEYRAG